MSTNTSATAHNTSTPESEIATAKDLLRKIRTGSQQLIADHQVAILKATNDLEAMNSKPDYELSIIKILEAFGMSSLAFIQQVLPDSQLLGKARKSLLESGRILENTEGTRKMLSLAEQPVAA